jgi:hypothetical protein
MASVHAAFPARPRVAGKADLPGGPGRFLTFAAGDRWPARALVVVLDLWLLLAGAGLGAVPVAMAGMAKGEAAALVLGVFESGVVFAALIWLLVAGILMLTINLARRHGR